MAAGTAMYNIQYTVLADLTGIKIKLLVNSCCRMSPVAMLGDPLACRTASTLF